MRAQRRAADALRGRRPQGAPRGARSSCSSRSASPRRRTSCRPRSPAASGSASRSRAPSRTGRRSCSPTSRRAPSTRTPARRSSSSSSELHRQGNTLVLVTHDPSIAALAQRQVELHDGLIAPRRTRPEAAVAWRTGAFRERVRNAWVEIRENLGALDPAGARRHARRRVGARRLLDLRQPAPALRRALREARRHRQAERAAVGRRQGRQPRRRSQTANLGLRRDDAERGRGPRRTRRSAESAQQKFARARRALAVRRPGARRSAASAATSSPLERLRDRAGPRLLRAGPRRAAAPVAILGQPRPRATFFPTGDAVGQTIRVGDIARHRRRRPPGEGLPLPRKRSATSSPGATASSPCRRRSSPGA